MLPMLMTAVLLSPPTAITATAGASATTAAGAQQSPLTGCDCRPNWGCYRQQGGMASLPPASSRPPRLSIDRVSLETTWQRDLGSVVC